MKRRYEHKNIKHYTQYIVVTIRFIIPLKYGIYTAEGL